MDEKVLVSEETRTFFVVYSTMICTTLDTLRLLF